MDSILVVCYSYSGTTLRLAQLLASRRGWPLAEIKDADSRSGSLRCVMDSLLRRQPHITYDGPDPANFRTVVLMAPIWMYRLASPMRTFVHVHKGDLKRVAVVCTEGAAGAANAFTEIAHVLGHAPVATAAFLQREIADGSCTGRLLDFGEALQPGTAPRQPAARPAPTIQPTPQEQP